MTLATFERLEALQARYGREFGKLCQKFLAIAFHEAGFPAPQERGVQGVDIDVASDGERYAVEVKTTEGDSIGFERKDAEGLAMRRRDGYQPVLAVLQIRLFAEWMFVRTDRLLPGSWLVDALRPYRLRELERRVAPLFDAAVERHYAAALEGGQSYLDEVLTALREGVARER
jgi:Holliday junction resolvase